ncbi:hypothetical protein [Polaromonas sp.]|uniref:hypothetical protein n=1 Tax=Polaromonas sp. TaxID=1869339 RepID=UPI00286B2062|nr:hypothetical protein [Polaromonas sp.]
MNALNIDFSFINAPHHSGADGVMGRCGSFPVAIPVLKNLRETVFSAIRQTLASVLAVSLLATPLISIAGSSEGQLLVSATVLKHASLQVLVQPASVHVTAADIARGYVDVPNPAQVAVQSNTPNGYLLTFESQGEFLRHTLVKGLGPDVQLGASGGGVSQRAAGRGMSKTLLDLGFRFVLSDSARQGVYAWPLRLSVAPL